MKILLVCSGNTCRSPMAAGILQKLLPAHTVSSAGIYAANGLPAAEHAVTAAREAGVDITAHRSRKITEETASDCDYILCMTRGQKQTLEGVNANTFTLGEFAGDGGEIADPYGGSLDDYRACARRLEQLLRVAAERIHAENRTV
ncbi:MAG: low molecular weight protein arginine phosphatase [Clostridiales bacterium]|jgi:protein-tyrosine-phosphatase|nr:low molecular weight protein arginine phosphatase [Clostridiales bacterium]